MPDPRNRCGKFGDRPEVENIALAGIGEPDMCQTLCDSEGKR